MREHEACEDVIFTAMSTGHPGKAEFLAARCDLWHGHIATPEPPPERPTKEEIA